MTRVTHIDETVTIGGDLTVGRIGYGAMQLTGPKVWGEYPDHDKCLALLREVVAARLSGLLCVRPGLVVDGRGGG